MLGKSYRPSEALPGGALQGGKREEACMLEDSLNLSSIAVKAVRHHLNVQDPGVVSLAAEAVSFLAT